MKLVSLGAGRVPIHFQLVEGAKSKSSLLNRFSITLNWEKAILHSNIAIITAGIAYGFFMRLPMMMLGLSLYGLLYLGLHSKVINDRPTGDALFQLRAQLEVEEEEHNKLSKKLEAHVDSTESLQMQLENDRRQFSSLNKRKQRIEADVNKLQDEADELASKLKRLKRGRS